MDLIHAAHASDAVRLLPGKGSILERGSGGSPPPPPSVAVGWCRHFAIIRKISHSSLRHVYAGREKVNPDIDRVSAGCSACCDLAAIVSMQNVQPASRHIVAILRALVTCSARHKTASAGF